ncbi:MAG TPA: TonB family protein [Chitinophagaceae bacterium]|nr:TonB family protein [Chitinophagaceae bacterium]
MSTDNNIKNFTAADIEKYHKGLLSAKERHDLEKAALDDPFLADALEGYAVAGENASADILELQKRLAEKMETGKVVAMKTGGKTSFPWLRAVALLVIVAGAGLLAQQLFFTNQSKNNIAEAKKPGETKINDTTNAVAITAGVDTVRIKPGYFDNGLNQTDRSSAITPKVTPDGSISKEASGGNKVTTTEVVANNFTQPVTTAPLKIEDKKPTQYYNWKAADADKKEIAREEVKNKPDTTNKQFFAKERDGVKDQPTQQGYTIVQPGNDAQKNRSVAANRKFAEDQNSRGFTNTFRGRVTDANNVGLPFARVYNPTDNNAGTYTDVAGNFNLTYPDSVLTVQVKSVGFENTNVQLRNSVANNQVVLQDDRSLAAQTMPTPRKINAEERSKTANVKLEEPEPADGWDNYDTYITNNLNPPDEIRTRKDSGGEVEISFEVDKNGNPVNIKVEKSLCSKCDQEAIRLIKQGPKWKRNAKKGRTTVTVPFNNSL